MDLQFTFNGMRKSYISVLSDLRRPILPTISYTTSERTRAGEQVTGMKLDTIILDVPVVINHRGKSLQELKFELSTWLYSEDEQKLVFSDKPSRYYMARFLSMEFEEYEHFSKGVIQFLCPTPFQYATEMIVPIPNQADIEVMGQIPVYWTLQCRIEAKTNQFEVINQAEEKLILYHQFQENDVIQIDTQKRVIFLNRESRMSLLAFESKWFSLKPGMNTVYVTQPSTLSYQNIYL